jgi:hypothetical protein
MTKDEIKVPYITKELFAERTGLTVRAVESMVYRNQLPTVKRGRRVLINIYQEFKELSGVEDVAV